MGGHRTSYGAQSQGRAEPMPACCESARSARVGTALLAWPLLMVAFGTAHAQEAAGPRIDIETGIEFRLRAEALEGGDFPSAEGGARLLWRAMPRAEADARPLRGVIQLIATGALSSDLAVGPVDDTGIEVLQAYGELHLPAGEGELALAAGRLLIGFPHDRKE